MERVPTAPATHPPLAREDRSLRDHLAAPARIGPEAAADRPCHLPIAWAARPDRDRSDLDPSDLDLRSYPA